MKKINILFLIVIAVLSFCITSCDKNDNDVNIDMAEQIIKAESYFHNIFKQSQLIMNRLETIVSSDDTVGGAFSGPHCAKVTVLPFDTISWPKNISIDYGDTNCFGVDKRYRRGRIQMETTGFLSDSLFSAQISFHNFYINDNKILGAITVEREGVTVAGNPLFNVQFSEGGIITAAGTIYWSGTRSIEWTNGHQESDSDGSDFKYSITGMSSEGISVKGRPFTADIFEPLVLKASCAWIVSGALEFMPYEGALKTLDFGSGTCNHKAALSVDGKVIDLIIP